MIRRNHAEHNLQCACVKWFALQFPRLRGRLIAVPNGGGRSPVEGARLKQEGVVAGVADLLLLVPRHGYGALCVEMKTPARGSRQSERQKEWETNITANGDYKYVVCRTLEEFVKEITEYMT